MDETTVFSIPGKKTKVTLQGIIDIYKRECATHGQKNIKLIVGTDSQRVGKNVFLTTAFTLYRQGKGGRIFYLRRKRDAKRYSVIATRLLKEAEYTINITQAFISLLQNQMDVGENVNDFVTNVRFEVHFDANPDVMHASNQIVHAVSGWANGMGLEYHIKPEAWGASTVADKFAQGKAR